MAELTKLLNPVIPNELVGQHATIDGGVYDDAYLSQINSLYSLNDILGERKKGIAKGSWNDLNHFTMGSPLNNTEGEQILNAILYFSAKAGLWQPKIIDVPKLTDTLIKTSKQYLGAVEVASRVPGLVVQGSLYGLRVAKTGGF